MSPWFPSASSLPFISDGHISLECKSLLGFGMALMPILKQTTKTNHLWLDSIILDTFFHILNTRMLQPKNWLLSSINVNSVSLPTFCLSLFPEGDWARMLQRHRKPQLDFPQQDPGSISRHFLTVELFGPIPRPPSNAPFLPASNAQSNLL